MGRKKIEIKDKCLLKVGTELIIDGKPAKVIRVDLRWIPGGRIRKITIEMVEEE